MLRPGLCEDQITQNTAIINRISKDYRLDCAHCKAVNVDSHQIKIQTFL